jgi:hypothetical protein
MRDARVRASAPALRVHLLFCGLHENSRQQIAHVFASTCLCCLVSDIGRGTHLLSSHMLAVDISQSLASHLRGCNKGATADPTRIGSVITKSG